jgi:alpha-N-arabinofuranosidase
LAVVNIHEEKGFETVVEGVVGTAQVFTVTGGDVMATNMKETEEVRVEESVWNGEGKYVFPKHSLTLLRWKAE